MAGARVPSPFPARHHAGRSQQADGRLVSRRQSADRRGGARRRRRRTAGRAAAGGRRERSVGESGGGIRRCIQHRDRADAAGLAAGTIVKTTQHPEAGITEWTLSNGATVVLKPTTLRENQILFQAFAPGGTSLASDAELVPVRAADEVVPAGGVGGFSGVTLDKI